MLTIGGKEQNPGSSRSTLAGLYEVFKTVHQGIVSSIITLLILKNLSWSSNEGLPLLNVSFHVMSVKQ